MKNFLIIMHSGIDNKTPDIVRILCSLCIFTVLFLSIWNATYMKIPTEFASLGAAIAQVLGATGLAIKLKENTEPQSEDTKENS